jgi:hypothetical protein
MLAEILKQGTAVYKPSNEASEFIKNATIEEIAFSIPQLVLKKIKIDSFEGEIGSC